MRPVLVFGHRNPDSDSVCAAVAYAHLKNRVESERVYVPVRLGEAPSETRWLFDRFGAKMPERVEHVRLRVRDAMAAEVVTVAPDESLLAVGRLMREHDIRAVPVCEDGRVLGIVSTETLAARYLRILEPLAAGTLRESPALLASDVMDSDVTPVDPDALLADAADDLVSSPHRSAVVIDADGRLAGILTRTSLARAGKREVVLVDHSETAQSAEGIEEAAIIEVVDHHRIGDIETAAPISFTAMPVGSTCTIVASRYFEHDVTPPVPMAALMLGALLSDTVLLKSPTTTGLDREVAQRLAAVVDVDALELGMELVRARTAGQPFSAERVVCADVKEFHAGDAKIAVAQHETPDLEGVLEHRDELTASMEALRVRRGYDLVLLMVTDIVREGTELLAAGNTRIAERALDTRFEDGSVWLPGVLSRKRQVAARLLG
ncbi:MAG TPA: putative manganese-dependent inorganic diphosphatase [Coriobacteriia bacterium]